MVPSARPLRLFTLMAVSLAIAMLWLHPDLGRPVFVGLSMILLWPSLAMPWPAPWPLWRKMWNAVLLIALGPAIATWFVAPDQALRALVALIVLAEMRWAYNPAGARQMRLMLALGAVLVVLTCQASESAWLAVLAGPFLLFAVGTLLWSEIAMRLEIGSREDAILLESHGADLLSRRIWLPPLRLAIISACLGAALFLVIPRISTGRIASLASVNYQQDMALTGLTTQIEHGAFARLLEDPTPAVEVTWLSTPPAQTIYLREGTLTELVTGDRWVWTTEGVEEEILIEPGAVTPLITDEVSEDAVGQRVEILDPDLRSILGMPWMTGVRSAQGGTLTCVDGDRWRTSSVDNRWPVYEVWSEPGEGRRLSAPGPEASHVPESLRRRVREFLIERRIVSTLDSPERQAETIADHLRTTHRHSLDLREIRRSNPLEDFIFHPRAGNCEYFAAAMVVMCRAMGVPARLVTGFMGGEPTPSGAQLFRRSDAHAWVEIWDPNQGWIFMDPTPPEPLVVSSDLGLWMRFTEVAGGFAGQWREHIVDYEGAWYRRLMAWSTDRADQLVAFAGGEPGVFRRFLVKARRNLSQEPMLWGMMGGLLTLNLLLMWLDRWLRRRPWIKSSRTRDPRETLLARMARALSQRPRPRRPGETAAEYLRSVAAGSPDGVAPLVECYYRWRHDPSAKSITPGELMALARKIGASPQGAQAAGR